MGHIKDVLRGAGLARMRIRDEHWCLRARRLALSRSIRMPDSSDEVRKRCRDRLRPRRRKLGYLHPVCDAPDTSTFSAMALTWRRLGYREGGTVLLRAGEGRSERMASAVQELIGLGAEANIVVGPKAVRAAMSVTRTVPIIGVDLETDPVRSGRVRSFARPGGDLTGLFMDLPELAGKWLQLLREAAPGLARIALIWDPTAGPDQLDAARGTLTGTGLESSVLEARSGAEQAVALRSLSPDRPTGVVQPGSPRLANNRERASFAEPTFALKLPSITFFNPIATRPCR